MFGHTCTQKNVSRCCGARTLSASTLMPGCPSERWFPTAPSRRAVEVFRKCAANRCPYPGTSGRCLCRYLRAGRLVLVAHKAFRTWVGWDERAFAGLVLLDREHARGLVFVVHTRGLARVFIRHVVHESSSKRDHRTRVCIQHHIRLDIFQTCQPADHKFDSAVACRSNPRGRAPC